MAQGEDITHLEIGREVYLRKVGDHYLFTVKSHLRKVREALNKLLTRGRLLPTGEKMAPSKKEKL